MGAWGSTVTVMPTARAAGHLTVPGDKSISHRYAMLAALAEGTSVLHGYLPGADCLATLACVRALGADVARDGDRVRIEGCGLDGLRAPASALDAMNSGTTMRLMTGILAAQPFRSVFIGDESLSRRPMDRIIVPLQQMGAHIDSTGGRPPLTIHGRPLHGIRYTPPRPSAQVKSGVLLAGLYAAGATLVEEPAPTRDHTERALETFGVPVHREAGLVGVSHGHRPVARELWIPGDISSATFWCVLAGATAGGDVTIERVGLNPTRTAVLDVLRRAGVDLTVTPGDMNGSEPVGTIRARHRTFTSFAIEPEEVPGMIDEIPALAALGAMMPAGCSMSVRGAAELRVKESDRISALAAGFRALGSEVDEFEDGFTLRARPLHASPCVTAAGDHRLAMAFMIAASRASGPVTIADVAVDVSYPGFMDAFARLTGTPLPAESDPQRNGSTV